MSILITGGAGYIGSHTCVAFIQAGYDLVVLDNLCNSSAEALKRVQQITGTEVQLYQGDIRDPAILNKIFAQHQIDAVIHFAGLKAVGESTTLPLNYYDNNVAGTINLCQVMREHGCYRIVFSSSATVYGEPETVPILESFPTGPTNPYGRSKLIVEEILSDLQKSQPEQWAIGVLRYFNPIGAHPSGLIGEDPNDIPNNLLPYVAQVAAGRLPQVKVFGQDYPTPDGTGVRDYLHVMDLAEGHLHAYRHLQADNPGLHTYNLGTGQGYSVLDIIQRFRAVSGQEIPYEMAPRRPGDIATCYANADKARDELGWQCHYDLQAMIEDTWRWQQRNPNGYRSS